MSLIHKGIAFKYIETDPYDKNPGWMSVSRGTGQVPVLVDDKYDVTVPDSGRSLEYLDAVFPDDLVRPLSASEEAEDKYWMDYQGRAIIPFIYRFLAAEKGSAAADEARDQLEQGLEAIASHIDTQGPYFRGDQPGSIDFSLAPFALRVEILLSHYMDYELPSDGEAWVRYHRWLDAIRTSQPMVKSSTGLSDYKDRLIHFYLPYSKGGGQADVTQVK